MEPRPIVFKEWRDTRTFSNLKATHCTLFLESHVILYVFWLVCTTWLRVFLHEPSNNCDQSLIKIHLWCKSIVRYKFFNLEHLLLYINNIQIQLNINTQKLQSFLIIRKTTKNNNMFVKEENIYMYSKVEDSHLNLTFFVA
jgi:hypothetical protein